MLRCKAESQIVNFKFADFVNKELKEGASLLHQFLFAVACPPGASRNAELTVSTNTGSYSEKILLYFPPDTFEAPPYCQAKCTHAQ